MIDVKVISLGGSIIAPDKVDEAFLRDFQNTLVRYLEADKDRKLILVCGGGGPARAYQQAYKNIHPDAGDDALDWIGIAATRLNAELLKHLFRAYCTEKVVVDPTAVAVFPGRVLIAAGWKPGFSTDYDAVLLAEKFQAPTLINLSNITQVYSADPKQNPDAEPLDQISWNQLRDLVGSKWIPGQNVPFDPVATEYADRLKLQLIVAGGQDMENLTAILTGHAFLGTVIGPE